MNNISNDAARSPCGFAVGYVQGSLSIPGLLKTQFITVGWLEYILILNGLQIAF